MSAIITATETEISIAKKIAAEYRGKSGQGYEHGYVLVFGNQVFGWQDELRPKNVAPGALAVDPDSVVFEAVGGNGIDGAQEFVRIECAEKESDGISLYATIKKTSKYYSQNNFQEGPYAVKGKPIPFSVSGIGNGNFGPDSVFGNFNQYPMEAMNFFIADARGRFVKLGGC